MQLTDGTLNLKAATDFRIGQAKIYSGFEESKELHDKGIAPSPVFKEPIAAYVVSLRHSLELREALAQCSCEISKVIPGLKYTSDAVHTSIITSQNFPAKDFSPDSDVPELLHKAVFKTAHERWFAKPYYNVRSICSKAEAAILTGEIKGFYFTQLADDILTDLSKRTSELKTKIEMKAPQMTHCTLYRYGVAESDPQKIAAILDILSRYNRIIPKISRCEKVDIGYGICNPEAGTFEYKILSSVALCNC